jgi:hypothetical protein
MYFSSSEMDVLLLGIDAKRSQIFQLEKVVIIVIKINNEINKRKYYLLFTEYRRVSVPNTLPNGFIAKTYLAMYLVEGVLAI